MQGRFLEVRYEPFSKLGDAAIWKSALYRLEHELDVPILWLNSDHRELLSILDSKATRGAAARMREVFFAQIAHSVWMRLFMTAAEASANDAEREHAWRDSVLRRFLPALFPELADHSSRLEELGSRIQAGAVHDIVQQIDRVLQDDLHIVNYMKALVEEKGE